MGLDWLLIVGRRHLEQALGVDVQHYNRHRPHRGWHWSRRTHRSVRVSRPWAREAGCADVTCSVGSSMSTNELHERICALHAHQYVVARRIDAARRRLLDGEPIAQVAAGVGFYDQAHLTRQFKRHVGTPPGRYVRSSTDEPAADSAAADGAASSHSS